MEDSLADSPGAPWSSSAIGYMAYLDKGPLGLGESEDQWRDCLTASVGCKKTQENRRNLIVKPAAHGRMSPCNWFA